MIVGSTMRLRLNTGLGSIVVLVGTMEGNGFVLPYPVSRRQLSTMTFKPASAAAFVHAEEDLASLM
jgi:hypothetical protein